ncbi:uncharacterized protein METZ01_LOCUS92671 [marine metagenome]|uniref:Uncharacterized protein n=1 Tax=marine metagenome TaxID=408172 RepID=A0A381VJI4_9ZZZZ
MGVGWHASCQLPFEKKIKKNDFIACNRMLFYAIIFSL